MLVMKTIFDRYRCWGTLFSDKPCHSTQYTPRVSNAIALHFSPCFQRFAFVFFPTFFLSFLHFPPFSPCFQRFSFLFCRFFPTFFLSFLHFPPVFNYFPSFFSCLFPDFPPVFNDFPSISLVFSSLFPAGVNGPRGNRSLSSPLCVVVHAPQKSSMCPPSTATNFEILTPYATTTPQTP